MQIKDINSPEFYNALIQIMIEDQDFDWDYYDDIDFDDIDDYQSFAFLSSEEKDRLKEIKDGDYVLLECDEVQIMWDENMEEAKPDHMRYKVNTGKINVYAFMRIFDEVHLRAIHDDSWQLSVLKSKVEGGIWKLVLTIDF